MSWTEATRFADPAVIAESVQISRHALAEYRKLRRKGLVDDMTESPDVNARTEELLSESHAVIRAIETSIPDAWTPSGLYRMFAAGFLPVPYLWECREELAGAIDWRTRLIKGAVRLVDERGAPLTAAQRIEKAVRNMRHTIPRTGTPHGAGQ